MSGTLKTVVVCVYFYYNGYCVTFRYWTNKYKKNTSDARYSFRSIDDAITSVIKRSKNPLHIEHSEIELNYLMIMPSISYEKELIKLALNRGECKKYDVKIVEFLP